MSDEKIVKLKKNSGIEIRIDETDRIGGKLIKSLRSNPEEMGEKMLDLATSRVEKQFAEEVLRQIEELVKHKNNLLVQLDRTAKEIALTERRIAAVNSGEFKIDWNGKIQYTDVALNFN